MHNVEKAIFDDKKTVYIYGAGKRGKQLLELLARAGIKVKSFIVTIINSENSEVDGIPIVSITESISRDSIILVATAEKFWQEIETSIQGKGLTEYVFVDASLLKVIKRKAYKIEPSKFLEETEPVSRVFGFDRGTPIDRYYIDRFIERNESDINDRNGIFRILEIGEDIYSRKMMADLSYKDVRYDILNYQKGEDLTDINTLRENYYDLFICTQTFNFIYDVKKAIEGAYYTIKPKGILLATVAGVITPVSRYDMDRWGHYWGFTDLSIRKMMADVFGEENVKVITYGNALASTAFVQGIALEDIDDPALLDNTDRDYQILIGISAKKNVD